MKKIWSISMRALTNRQLEVLKLLTEGLSNKKIANKLTSVRNNSGM
jgi:DNA-binding NarL/FixJ family response regulator